jgi:hypothetical protein
LHASGSYPGCNGGGNRTAEEGLRPAAKELGSAGEWVCTSELAFLAPDFVATLNINQQEIGSDIEDGRDATLPLWNRDPHSKRTKARYMPKPQLLLVARGWV